jgi:drug/metabolite transporter (DMT)-like permease
VIIGLAMTGIFLYALCFFHGLKQISAGRGALVVALNPVRGRPGRLALGQEKMTPLKVAGIVIAMIGCLTVSATATRWHCSTARSASANG